MGEEICPADVSLAHTALTAHITCTSHTVRTTIPRFQRTQRIQRIQRIRRIQHIQRIQRIQHLQRIQRIQHIQRIQRIQHIKSNSAHTAYSAGTVRIIATSLVETQDKPVHSRRRRCWDWDCRPRPPSFFAFEFHTPCTPLGEICTSVVA